jgi:hypothetical protein
MWGDSSTHTKKNNLRDEFPVAFFNQRLLVPQSTAVAALSFRTGGSYAQAGKTSDKITYFSF